MSEKRAVSPEDKVIARYEASVFGGKPVVFNQFHNTLPLSVGILEAADRPNPGLTSYGTVGLWNTPLKWGEGEFPTRLELVGAFPTAEKAFRDVLAGAAFNIMRTSKPCYPGAVMPDYVREWFPAAKVPHLYFTSPSLWGDMKPLEVGGATVNWLQAFPISEAERVYLKEHGDNALEDIFVEKDVDIFDLSRASAV